MIELSLKRFKIDLRGVLGEIFLGEEHLCWTLERPWEYNKPYVSCVPAQRYDIEKWFDSDRNSFVFWLKDVPGRSEILIHPGNKIADSSGCILPGISYDEYDDYFIVNDSRDAIGILNMRFGNFPSGFLNVIDESKKTVWVMPKDIMETREAEVSGKIRYNKPKLPKLTVKEVPYHEIDTDVPFWKQPGFKRSFGIITMGIGYIVEAFGIPIGTGIKYIGMGISGIGLGHAVLKSSPKHDKNKGFVAYVMELLNYIIQLIKQKLRRKP